MSQDLLGIMVWYASVKGGFDYSPVWDASTSQDAIRGYTAAMQTFRDAMGSQAGSAVVPAPAPSSTAAPIPSTTAAPAPSTTAAPAFSSTAAPPAPAPVVAEQPEQANTGHPAWPSKVLGLYVLLADDTEDGFGTKADWEPTLFPWQQEAANVLFFTFIHPDSMEVMFNLPTD